MNKQRENTNQWQDMVINSIKKRKRKIKELIIPLYDPDPLSAPTWGYPTEDIAEKLNEVIRALNKIRENYEPKRTD